MTITHPGRRPISSRPFYTTVFLITLLATYAIFLRGHAKTQYEGASLQKRSGEDCRLVHNAEDKCAFVKRNCHDDEAGLLEYLSLYYCSLDRAQPVAFIILVLWLGLLFTTIGVAASDFFSVNLSTIATILGLSESLAGVTFLALGNGSPDVFSTFAAMGSNSGSMAVGELIGAAGFITSVVAGSMALVREFKVGKTFVRDICFFIAAVAFAMTFLSDGAIHLWECCVMIGFYVFYVLVVVGWHAVVKRRRARRAKEAASRGHFYGSSRADGNDELEPYRDDPEDEDGPADGRSSARLGPASVDIGVLERGPRIEVGPPTGGDDFGRSQHIAAEMTSSMRVSRPRGRRSNTTITPIRPSLVGALEFRSVLSSLQEEGNVRLRPIHARSRSHDILVRRSGHLIPANAGGSTSVPVLQATGDGSATRNRALSSGAVPPTLDADLALEQQQPDRSRATSTHTIRGRLAPPPSDQLGLQAVEDPGSAQSTPPASPRLHRLRIPSPAGSERSSPAVSPFPSYTESPMILTPDASAHPDQPPSLMLPTPSIEHHLPFPGLDRQLLPKPVSWWPYSILPPPHVVFGTLFPTLQDWKSKSIWDKFVSLISVPSIFLLVITLPVVESETTDDESDVSIEAQPASGHLGNTAAPVTYNSSGAIEPETEWQRYRRSTRSIRSGASTPPLLTFDAPDEGQGSGVSQTDLSIPALGVPPSKPVSELGQGSSILADDDQGWNRWLLFLQVFTGPLFCVFVVWANMAEDLDNPIKDLVRAMLISLVGSLVVLGILLVTTSPDRRPKYHFLFCFLGFCIAIAWISTIAGEVVGVLKAFGVILDISEAILGLTIFAVGNSVGDLVADITVARLGYPLMALSACFGGPLLNILLGIGLGGAWQTIQAANKKHAKHPDQPWKYKPYHIQVSGTLMISAITLLATLLALLIIVPMNKWVMSRKIGWFLIALWTVSTIGNLVIEITGVWRDVA